MPRQSTSFDLALPDKRPGEAAYRWLYRTLRAEILAGDLRPGTQLPATRDLAAQYALSRGTIVRAFEDLKAEGYAEGNTGSGTYVSRVLPESLLTAPEQPRPARRTIEPTYRASAYSGRVKAFGGFDQRTSVPFRANLPALDLFPMETWAKLATKRMRGASMGFLTGCNTMGYLPLRRTLAEYLGRSRGVKCAAEQIAIVSGVQEALDLTARLLIDPGDRVAVEDPGYPGAVNAFVAAGAEIVPIGVDEEGMLVDPRRLRDARLVYVTPGHQFPLGMTMSLPRRLALLGWAAKSGAMIFEDDYDSEYRYEGRPLPALESLDRDGRVLFAGSFSKVLFPALRLGYLVVPPALVDRCAAVISITRRHAPVLEQAIVCDFITEGHFARHLRRMRQIYAGRLAALVEGAQQHWSGLLEIRGVEAGLQTAGWIRCGAGPYAAQAAAAERGVDVTPLDEYSVGQSLFDGLQLGFAAFNERAIQRGVTELAIALEAAVRLPR